MKHKKQHFYQLADAVGISQTTARKYLKANRLPGELKKPHNWRTREDAFGDIWSEAVKFLENNSGLEAKALFKYIQGRYPGMFKDNQLRTFQRRVKQWKALYGPAQEVYFAQDYKPGQFAASDFTKMNDIGITINGEPFSHLLFHFVLCYSNYESATIVRGGESFENLSIGFQNALWQIGKVPTYHKTDNLSAAVAKVGYPKEYTDNYKALTNHYGTEPISIQPGKPNENGDVEQSHYRLTMAIEQGLIFRGSKDFDSVEQYNDFVQRIIKQRNSQRKDKLCQDLKAMDDLPARRYDDHKRFKCKVSRFSTVTVQKNIYSVHSRLIGTEVEARVLPAVIEIWHSSKLVERHKRLTGSKKHSINYRHVIDSLVRKSGAFENYRYKDDLFPSSIFRVAYDVLTEIFHSRKSANKQYIKILELAAKESESIVRSVLKTLIDNNNPVSFEVVEAMVKSQIEPDTVRDAFVADIDLGFYDDLLEEVIV